MIHFIDQTPIPHSYFRGIWMKNLKNEFNGDMENFV